MAAARASAKEKAYRLIQQTARVRLHELKDNPGARTDGRVTRKAHNQTGHTQGTLERAAKPPLGWIWGDFFRPWHRMFPGERKMNDVSKYGRPMVPLSLLELSRLIDLGWIDATKPIDLPALLATRKFRIRDEAGIMLTPEGEASFSHRVDLEVQSVCQQSIAAVERAGGTLRAAYYDPLAIKCAASPKEWFLSGEPIPSRKAPPPTLLEYYSSALNRGYLANHQAIDDERKRLSHIYGYSNSEESAREEKEPVQIFHGLPAGSIVSIKDQKVLLPTTQTHLRFYTKSLAPSSVA